MERGVFYRKCESKLMTDLYLKSLGLYLMLPDHVLFQIIIFSSEF